MLTGFEFIGFAVDCISWTEGGELSCPIDTLPSGNIPIIIIGLVTYPVRSSYIKRECRDGGSGDVEYYTSETWYYNSYYRGNIDPLSHGSHYHLKSNWPTDDRSAHFLAKRDPITTPCLKFNACAQYLAWVFRLIRVERGE